MKLTTTIRGMEDIDDLLSKVAPNVAYNIMRATVHGVAGQIAKDAKGFMSVDTGTMKKATKPKRERMQGGAITSTVRVGRAAYYWRFREYGQGPDGEEDAMFMKAVAIFRSDMNRIFTEQFGKKWEATLARARKKQGG